MSWIQEEINARGGAVRFRDFMGLALYHIEHGYYSADSPRYGRAADFLTAPTASQWYASVLAGWCERLCGSLGPIVLVDLAAGDGALIDRLCARLGADAPRTLARVVAVERSPAMRRLQMERLREMPVEVEVEADLASVASASDFVLLHASELYDAMPVHRVVGRVDGVYELWVVPTDNGLEWEERPADRILLNYLADHGVVLQPGQIAELNLEAAAAHRSALHWAGAKALSLVLDYGYEARRLYNPRGRSSGSLSCYRKHQLVRDPLVHPGEQDITAHVNWDDLRAAAAASGWSEVGLWSLAELLVRAGVSTEMERVGLGMEAELDARTVSERQEIKRLLDPEGMGSDLKTLVQATPAVADTVAQSLLLS